MLSPILFIIASRYLPYSIAAGPTLLTEPYSFYTSASAMHGCRLAGGGRSGRVALPVKALKAGQEAYWLDQIARNREEYFLRPR